MGPWGPSCPVDMGWCFYSPFIVVAAAMLAFWLVWLGIRRFP